MLNPDIYWVVVKYMGYCVNIMDGDDDALGSEYEHMATPCHCIHLHVNVPLEM